MKQNKSASKFGLLLASAALAALPMTAGAAGFQLSEHSAESLGRANAGGAAAADDATAVVWNPANLVLVKKPEMIVSNSLIRLGADFDKISATDAIGQPLSGGEGGDVGKLGGTPGLFYAAPLNDKASWGISLTAPFGLSTDLDADSIFRYQAIYSAVAIIQINPSVGYQIYDNWSIGAGLDFQFMRVKLTQAVDFGAVCFGTLDPITCQGIGLTPQNVDGYAELEGDSFDWGWNVGITYHYDHGRIGAAYRSTVKHGLDGDATFLGSPAAFVSQGVFTNSGITADFETPDFVSVSWMHELDEKWTITADWTYTEWSSFQELRVNYDNPLQPDTVEEEGWKNVSRFSLGLDWEYNEDWTFRAGIAYDESPIPDPDPATFGQAVAPGFEFDASRTARLPGADRRWIAFGATWKMNEHTEISAAWDHLYLNDDIPFDHTGSTGDRVVGFYEADADILSLQMRHIF